MAKFVLIYWISFGGYSATGGVIDNLDEIKCEIIGHSIVLKAKGLTTSTDYVCVKRD